MFRSITTRKRLLIVATALMVAAIFAAPTSAFRRLQVGDTIGDFTGDTLDGDPFQLSANMGEKATILLFWATWSPRSSIALADYQEFWKAHHDMGLSVVGLNVEHDQWIPEDLPLIRAALEEAQVAYPVAADKSLDFYNHYGVNAVPSTALMDGKGKVAYLLPGYPTMLRDEFREKVEELLGIVREEIKRAKPGYKPKGKAGRYFNMAKLFRKKKMYRRATKNLEIALEEDPDYAEARELLEFLREEEGEPPTLKPKTPKSD